MICTLLLGVALVSLSAAGCSTTQQTSDADSAALHDAATGEPFRLEPGESVQAAGHALRFESVVEDSRCPENVSCVWEGRAKIRVSASNPEGHADSAILTVPHGALREGETPTWEVGGMVVTVLALHPYPGSEAAESGAPVEAELTVSPKE